MMSKCKILLVLFLCCGCGLTVTAQEVIKGMVRDAVYNDPIIGANVVVEGTTEGTISDWDGTFELKTNQSFPIVLRISYIGYADKTITLEENIRVDVSLNEDALMLEIGRAHV